MIEVEPGAGGPQLRRERPGQRGGQRFEDGHVDTEDASRGGHLGADEPGADHAQARRRLELGPDGQALIERAQHVDAGQLPAAGQPAGGGSGGDDEPVVSQRLAVVEGDSAGRHVEGRSPAPEMPGHAQRVVLALVPQRRLLGLPVALEHLLRQRRPVVGQRRLGPDGDQLTLEPLLAQRLQGRQPGQ